MNKKQPVALVIFSFILALSLFFLDESNYSFSFLVNAREVMNLLFFTALISVLPLVIYYACLSRFGKRTFFVALFGFVPALYLVTKAVGI